QPSVEEEALRLSSLGRELSIERQSMADSISDITVTSPSGKTTTVTLQAAEPGLWRGSMPVSELGLWRATDGKLTTLVNIGPPNPREFAEVTSTTNVLAALANATGGDARRVMETSRASLPRILPVRSTGTFHGD